MSKKVKNKNKRSQYYTKKRTKHNNAKKYKRKNKVEKNRELLELSPLIEMVGHIANNTTSLLRVDHESSIFFIPADKNGSDRDHVIKVIHTGGLTYTQIDNFYEFFTFLEYAYNKDLTVCVDYSEYSFVLGESKICIMLSPDTDQTNSVILEYETFKQYVKPYFSHGKLPFKNVAEIISVIGSSK